VCQLLSLVRIKIVIQQYQGVLLLEFEEKVLVLVLDFH
jgi:hypothetical protein